jgi:hypothetical protein
MAAAREVGRGRVSPGYDAQFPHAGVNGNVQYLVR